MRIGFLFNHDQIHQMAHALPIAAALGRSGAAEVIVAVTTDRLEAEAHRMAALLGAQLPIVRLSLTRAVTRVLAGLFDGVLPAARLGVYGDNLPFFRSLDALIVAEKTSLALKTRYGLQDLKLIHTRHGAGDRAIGFNAESARFDHVLVSGEKVRERLIRDAGVDADRLITVGYSKFDLWPDPRPRLPVQANGRKTVLYNPHPSPHLSSWYRHGRAILEFFRDNERYNLVFAPHVMLFERKLVWSLDKLRLARPGRLPAWVADAANIHVDLGSVRSTDMTYTACADIYLGDASSQIYEFLREPRPCLFVDSHGQDHAGDPNFAHWQAGEVIRDPAQLGGALARAEERHAEFRPVQEAMFARTFSLTDEPSAERAARAIVSVLTPSEPSRLPAAGAVDFAAAA